MNKNNASALTNQEPSKPAVKTHKKPRNLPKMVKTRNFNIDDLTTHQKYTQQLKGLSEVSMSTSLPLKDPKMRTFKEMTIATEARENKIDYFQQQNKLLEDLLRRAEEENKSLRERRDEMSKRAKKDNDLRQDQDDM